MDPFSIDILARNAFRTLGLPADATQEQIDSAARAMRIWQDSASIPPTSNDVPWLGPPHREPMDIEHAVSRLADPQLRVAERIWWFCQPPAKDAPAPATTSNDILQRHDAALVILYLELSQPADRSERAGTALPYWKKVIDDLTFLANRPFYRQWIDHAQAAGDNNEQAGAAEALSPSVNAGKAFPRWKSLLAELTSLANSPAYLQWLADAEAAGDFEKSASSAEIAAAQQRMPARVVTALVPLANAALDSENVALIAPIIELLRDYGSHPDDPPETSLAVRLLCRLEDLITIRCRELSQEVDTAWKTRKIAIMKAANTKVMQQFRSSVDPLINQLEKLSPDDLDRKDRVRVTRTQFLLHVAAAYEAMSDFVTAEATLLGAINMAAGTVLHPQIASRLDRIEPLAQKQRSRPAAQRAASASPAKTLVWLLFVVIFIGGRALMNFDTSNRSSYDSPQIETPTPIDPEILKQLQQEFSDHSNPKNPPTIVIDPSLIPDFTTPQQPFPLNPASRPATGTTPGPLELPPMPR